MFKEQTPPARPEISRQQVVAEDERGFYYPFPNNDEVYAGEMDQDQARAYETNEKFLADRGLIREDDDIYRAIGFDAQSLVAGLAAPVVEVAGPTGRGYALINEVAFGDRPIVSNIRGSYPHAKGLRPPAATLTAADRLVVDMLADARKLPLASNSVGVLLASCVEKNPPGMPINSRRSQKQVERAYQQALASADDPSSKEFQAAVGQNVRVGLAEEAARVIKPGGLFVLRGSTPEDIRLLDQFGFKLVMATPPYPSNGLRGGRWVVEALPRELAFQKPIPASASK